MATVSFANAYVNFLQRWKWMLLATFAALIAVGALLAPMSLGNMTTNVPAVPGTYSAQANLMMSEHFPDKMSELMVALVIRRKDEGPVLGQDLENFSTSILASVKTFQKANVVTRVDCWQCYAAVPEVQKTFLSPDGKVSLMAVNYLAENEDGSLLPALRAASAAAPAGLEIFLTGVAPLNEASLEGVMDNLREMDSIAFPAALLVLGCVLRSVRLMILPVLSVVTAAALSFGVMMFPISLLCDIFILAGSLMMSIVIALSIDYSLFLLTRFQVELKALSPKLPATDRVAAALVVSIETAGHTILVSGTTLTLAFVGLLLADDVFMTSVGLSSSMAIVAAMISALVATPALILSCPAFFAGAGGVLASTPRGEDGEKVASLQQVFEINDARVLDGNSHFDAPAKNPIRDTGDRLEREAEKLVDTRWFKFTCWVLAHKRLVSLILLVAFMWPLYRLKDLQISKSPILCVPRGNEAFTGFTLLHQSFGASMLWPMKILVVPQDQNQDTVFRPDFFHRVADKLENLKEELPMEPGFRVQSLVYSSQFGRINLDMVRAALPDLHTVEEKFYSKLESYMLCNATQLQSELCQLIRFGRQYLVNEDGTAMIVSVGLQGDIVTGDPWSAAGTEWIRALRSALQVQGPERYFVVSNPSSVQDTVDRIYSSGPLVVSVTAVAVALVVAISFHSLVVPLRLIPSMALSILWTYGMAVVVYQDGALAWTGISSLSPTPDGLASGIMWILPALCFTLLCGLCLDYDIFVLNRVAEFRLAGFNDHDSVALGISSTGHLITVAGCVMLIAFSGLLLSNQLILNQLSFFLIACVLLDTFVVRNIVVPICMDMLGSFSNWWPRKMPEPSRKLSGPLGAGGARL